MLAACYITYQCLYLDFCLEASIRSALDLCDQILVNDGGSSDGTLELLYSLREEHGEDRVKIFPRQWVHDRESWARERRFLISRLSNQDYVFAVDADEVLHEDDIPRIRALVDAGKDSISLPFLHFFGTPNHIIRGGGWYERHTRIWAIRTGISVRHIPGGCADDVLWPDGRAAHFCYAADAGAPVYHYGHCRQEGAFSIKQRRADSLYLGQKIYEDGSLPPSAKFEYNMRQKGVSLFGGRHPKYIAGWVDNHV